MIWRSWVQIPVKPNLGCIVLLSKSYLNQIYLIHSISFMLFKVIKITTRRYRKLSFEFLVQLFIQLNISKWPPMGRTTVTADNMIDDNIHLNNLINTTYEDYINTFNFAQCTVRFTHICHHSYSTCIRPQFIPPPDANFLFRYMLTLFSPSSCHHLCTCITFVL